MFNVRLYFEGLRGDFTVLPCLRHKRSVRRYTGNVAYNHFVSENLLVTLKLGLHDAICRTDSFLFMIGHCGFSKR